MAGPLPLVPENTPSSYGQEAQIQRDLASASQYNPATKLGITNEDQPSKKAPELNLTPPVDASMKAAAKPQPAGEAPAALPLPSLHQHFQKLASLPGASPEIQFYAKTLKQR